MIRFPKRPRSKSIDLEDDDLVEVGRPSEPDDLADTGVVPPRTKAASAAAAGSVAPVAMASRIPEETFLIPRLERHRESRVSLLFAAVGHRPSLPWAAALLALGAIGAAGSMRLLDALEGRSQGELPAAAASPPPAATTPLTPIAAPVAKPAPVVLKFGSADAVNVAVDAPKPAAPAAAAAAPARAPAALAAATVAPAPAPAAPKKIAVLPAAPPPAALPVAPPPAPADSVKRAVTVDSLAEQQLKAALK